MQPSVDPTTASPTTRAMAAEALHYTPRRRGRWQSFRNSWQLWVMILPPMIWLIVYQYIPIWGVQIAFRDYTFVNGITGSEWVGLKHFDKFIHQYNFWQIIRNTLILNIYSLIAGFPLPIILALALNSVARQWFKKTVQLVSYAPYFISVVVIVGMLFQFVATQGFFNQVLGLFGVEPINFMGDPKYWRSLYVWSGVWQNVGFGCIIYLAALAGIDPTLHEAAILDGANRLQRMRDIDLPGIMPVAIILLILNMGSLLSTGFEKVILMQNNLNKGVSEVIDSYVYNVSLAAPIPQWSYAAAVGLFKSVVALILLVAVNQLARRLKVASLW